MREKIKRPLAQWVEILAKKELPAITSVAGMLDKFSNDDISSIPHLSKAILHDQALSSCVLKVANNCNRTSYRKITTVSRASIVLGIQTIKNICLTSKILDGLLKSKNVEPEIYNRLTMLMANAFYAGLLAKMMVPDYDKNTQEEVYLAAMLYHIGETSFWSSNSEMTGQLIKEIDLPAAQFQEYCASMTGVHFKDLSIGLAKTWHLGELLIKALDQPESRTVEMQTISLANQLSAAIAVPPDNKSDLDKILKRISKIMAVDINHVQERIEETRNLAIKLLSSYGASVLEQHIKILPTESDYTGLQESSPVAQLTPEKALLLMLKTLTKLTKSSNNINDFLTYTLQQTAIINRFDRCTFWVLSRDRSKVESRTTYNCHGQVETFHSTISLNKSMNMFSYVLERDCTELVNSYRDHKWRNYITLEIEELIGTGATCFAPVQIEGKAIGVICAQVLDKSKKISDESFSQFSFIVDHLNMCLSMIVRR
ncbi:HDOD domain-containing protein [Psychromonas antarctica]|jgi:HD-like signal output (HDOD) protein|uniref:HDOD domain-containing protein n=1 Tax=Psychromonas antarctica TaxID=67573 RepID=UPI001EE80A70|nr:HDOD domain-containing protein [Psychromonas antarctica]MCG6202091.1 HDOD domain-containing protein [Psychromonas antarctica]